MIWSTGTEGGSVEIAEEDWSEEWDCCATRQEEAINRIHSASEARDKKAASVSTDWEEGRMLFDS